MAPDVADDWAAEPQWKATYTPLRVTADGRTLRDRSLPPGTWYLMPWEAGDAVANSADFTHLVTPGDPRLPQQVMAHDGPFVVSVTCTRCGTTAADSAGFKVPAHAACTPPPEPDTDDDPELEAVPAVDEQSAAPRRPVRRAPIDPTRTEAWLAAARTGDLIDAVNAGSPAHGIDNGQQWTVDLRFDLDAYGPEHASQLAELLATITGGRVQRLARRY